MEFQSHFSRIKHPHTFGLRLYSYLHASLCFLYPSCWKSGKGHLQGNLMGRRVPSLPRQGKWCSGSCKVCESRCLANKPKGRMTFSPEQRVSMESIWPLKRAGLSQQWSIGLAAKGCLIPMEWYYSGQLEVAVLVLTSFHLPRQFRTCTASNPAEVQFTWAGAAKTSGKAPILTFITTASTSAGAPGTWTAAKAALVGISPAFVKCTYLHHSVRLMLKFPICCSDQNFTLVLKCMRSLLAAQAKSVLLC